MDVLQEIKQTETVIKREQTRLELLRQLSQLEGASTVVATRIPGRTAQPSGKRVAQAHGSIKQSLLGVLRANKKGLPSREIRAQLEAQGVRTNSLNNYLSKYGQNNAGLWTEKKETKRRKPKAK